MKQNGIDMKKFKLGLIFTAMVAVLIPVTISGAQPAQAIDPDYVTMAQHIVDGTYTQTELNTCMASSYCVGLITGDGTLDTSSGGVSESLADVNSELSAQGLQTVSVTADKTACPAGSNPFYSARYWTDRGDLNGNVNYRWHYMQRFCRNDKTNKITKWIGTTDWLTDAKWYVEWTSDQTTSRTPTPCGDCISYRQRHIKLVFVVQIVPINFYPHAKFVIHGDGTPTGVVGGSR